MHTSIASTRLEINGNQTDVELFKGQIAGKILAKYV